MSTTSVCGSSGSVSLGGEISNWSVTIEQDAPEVTSMASLSNREYIPCLKSATCSFETFISCGAIGSQTGVDFVNDTKTISMDIILTDVSVTDPVDNVITFKYSGVSTGPVTIS